MPDQHPPRPRPLVVGMILVMAFVFMSWMMATLFELLAAGIPAEDRAGLAMMLIATAAGVVLALIAGVTAGRGDNPLTAFVSMLGALRHLLRR